MQNAKLANGQQPMANSINLSHPDSNRRYRNFTDSVLSSVNTCIITPSRSRGLSPPVGNFTLPRVFDYKYSQKIKNVELKIKNKRLNRQIFACSEKIMAKYVIE